MFNNLIVGYCRSIALFATIRDMSWCATCSHGDLALAGQPVSMLISVHNNRMQKEQATSIRLSIGYFNANDLEYR